MEKQGFLDTIKGNCPNADLELIKKAYDFGEAAHDGQFRKDSTTPFFTHPIAVATIISELQMDDETIVGSLLHDTVEDTAVTSEQISDAFGPNIAKLVDGVTKLESVKYENKKELQVENLRKMFIAMSSDIRVIIIKLADRLHNMRTLAVMPPEKQREKAEETLNIYAPIAHRLGIFKIKWELEDISLKYLDSTGYRDLVDKVNQKRSEREQVINQYIDQLHRAMTEASIQAEIYGRPKNFYSIYRKMKHQMKEFDEIYDLTAIRIIVESEKDLYAALGVVHSMWNFIPGRFKDYVSTPKQNMYRSLHTTLMGKKEPFEIQIRTREMHEEAEYGIAAHWKYKEGRTSKLLDDVDRKIQWFRQMMELQNDLVEPDEFMDSLRWDLLNTEVFVFTPNGDVIDLPEGSTPVDFAYKIHSGVGNNCIGAKVNGRIVPLNYHLNNGQIVEVLTVKNGNGPSRDWLNFVKSTQAKQKIKQWFKKERRLDNIEKGEEMLIGELKRHRIPSKTVLTEAFMAPIIKRLSLNQLEDLYNALGYGGISTNQVMPKLREKYRKEQGEMAPQQLSKVTKPRLPKPHSNGIVVKGIDDVLVRFAKCCAPVPGDQIIGYITRGRGVTIHRSDCPNFEKSEDTENRFIEVAWANSKNESYHASVQVVAVNRKGIMADITLIVNHLDMDMTGINAKVDKTGTVTVNLSVEIHGIEELQKLMQKLKSLQDVIDIKRTSV